MSPAPAAMPDYYPATIGALMNNLISRLRSRPVISLIGVVALLLAATFGVIALVTGSAAMLATRSEEAAGLLSAPAAAHDAATAAAGLATQLLAHVPEELRHA